MNPYQVIIKFSLQKNLIKHFQYIIWDTNEKEINISINGKELQKPKEWEIYDSLIPTENIKSIIINGVDYIDIYNKIYNNKLVGKDTS